MDERSQPIFKPKVRGPLQEVIFPDFPDDDNTVTTTVTKSRRVSFGTNFVKEFIVGSAASAQFVSEYEQAFSSSDSSNANSSHSAAESGILDPFASQENVKIHQPIPSVVRPGPDILENCAKRTKFTRTICFNADSPTADMEFTEGCITLAKNILEKKNKEMTVIIQAKPKDSKKEDTSDMLNKEETKFFEGSGLDMSMTKCFKTKETKNEEKSLLSEKTKIFSRFEDDMSITRCDRVFRLKESKVANDDDSDVSMEDNCKENQIPLDIIMRHLDKDTSDLDKSLFHPQKALNDVLNVSPFDASNNSEKLNLNESMDISKDFNPNLLKQILPSLKSPREELQSSDEFVHQLVSDEGNKNLELNSSQKKESYDQENVLKEIQSSFLKVQSEEIQSSDEFEQPCRKENQNTDSPSLEKKKSYSEEEISLTEINASHLKDQGGEQRSCDEFAVQQFIACEGDQNIDFSSCPKKVTHCEKGPLKEIQSSFPEVHNDREVQNSNEFVQPFFNNEKYQNKESDTFEMKDPYCEKTLKEICSPKLKVQGEGLQTSNEIVSLIFSGEEQQNLNSSSLGKKETYCEKGSLGEINLSSSKSQSEALQNSKEFIPVFNGEDNQCLESSSSRKKQLNCEKDSAEKIESSLSKAQNNDVQNSDEFIQPIFSCEKHQSTDSDSLEKEESYSKKVSLAGTHSSHSKVQNEEVGNSDEFVPKVLNDDDQDLDSDSYDKKESHCEKNSMAKEVDSFLNMVQSGGSIDDKESQNNEMDITSVRDKRQESLDLTLPVGENSQKDVLRNEEKMTSNEVTWQINQILATWSHTRDEDTEERFEKESEFEKDPELDLNTLCQMEIEDVEMQSDEDEIVIPPTALKESSVDKKAPESSNKEEPIVMEERIFETEKVGTLSEKQISESLGIQNVEEVLGKENVKEVLEMQNVDEVSEKEDGKEVLEKQSLVVTIEKENILLIEKDSVDILEKVEESLSKETRVLEENEEEILEEKEPPLTDIQVMNSLKKQSEEVGCVWSISNESFTKNKKTCAWTFNFKLLESTTKITFFLKNPQKERFYFEGSVVRSSEIHLNEDDRPRLPEYYQTLRLGFEKQKKFFEEEPIKLESVCRIPYFLDLVNSYTSKLNSFLSQIYSVLRKYPGSSLKDSILSFRLYSFPVFFSSTISIDLTELFALSKSSISFCTDLGSLNERKITEIFEKSLKKDNSIIEFIIESTKYIINLEREHKCISKRHHIELLPPELRFFTKK